MELAETDVRETGLRMREGRDSYLEQKDLAADVLHDRVGVSDGTAETAVDDVALLVHLGEVVEEFLDFLRMAREPSAYGVVFLDADHEGGGNGEEGLLEVADDVDLHSGVRLGMERAGEAYIEGIELHALVEGEEAHEGADAVALLLEVLQGLLDGLADDGEHAVGDGLVGDINGEEVGGGLRGASHVLLADLVLALAAKELGVLQIGSREGDIPERYRVVFHWRPGRSSSWRGLGGGATERRHTGVCVVAEVALPLSSSLDEGDEGVHVGSAIVAANEAVAADGDHGDLVLGMERGREAYLVVCGGEGAVVGTEAESAVLEEGGGVGAHLKRGLDELCTGDHGGIHGVLCLVDGAHGGAHGGVEGGLLVVGLWSSVLGGLLGLVGGGRSVDVLRHEVAVGGGGGLGGGSCHRRSSHWGSSHWGSCHRRSCHRRSCHRRSCHRRSSHWGSRSHGRRLELIHWRNCLRGHWRGDVHRLGWHGPREGLALSGSGGGLGREAAVKLH